MKQNISPKDLCKHSPNLSLWAQDVIDENQGMTPFIDETAIVSGFLQGLSKSCAPNDPIALMGWQLAQDETNPLRKSGIQNIKHATESLQIVTAKPKRFATLATRA